jgi:hypothetical protein
MNKVKKTNKIIDMAKKISKEVFSFKNNEILRIENWFKRLDKIKQNRFENILIRLWEIKKFTRDRFSNTLFLSLIFCIEGMINIFEKESSKDKFKKFLNSNLDKKDKKKLILAFTFSKEHICLCDAIKWQVDENIKNETYFEIQKDCSPTNISKGDRFHPICRCEGYLNICNKQKIEEYFNKLLDHFYEMRNSEVHRGFPIKLDFRNIDEYKEPETHTTSTYVTRDDKLILVSAVDINIYEIFIKAIKNKLKSIK